MVKGRSFMTGLGIGLICGVLMLQIINIGSEPVSANLESLNEQAELQGYQLVDANTKYYSQDEVDKLTETAVEHAMKTAEEQAAQAGDDADREDSTAVEPPPSNVWGFTIGPSTDTTTLARLLADMGLIASQKQFEHELTARKLNGKIQVDYYVYHQKPELLDLIHDITTPR